MKKIILSIFIVFSLYSCGDDFLNSPKPYDRVTDASFWKNTDDLEGAVNGIYYDIHAGGQNVSQMWVVTSNFPTNDFFSNEDVSVWDMIDLDFKPGNTRINNEWYASYKGITNANRVIGRGKSMNIDTEFKTKKIAEAKCLRSYFYLHLVRAYGDVPLIIEEQTAASNPYPTRTPKLEVINHMINDFTEAANGLPTKWDDANIGRVTKGTALALLQLINLYKEDWDASIAAFEQLENLGIYKLLPNYMDAYRWDNENNEESLFENQFADSPDMSIWLQNMLGPRDAGAEAAQWGTWGVYFPTQKLYDSMEPLDDRRKQFLTPGQSITLPNGYTYTMKGGGQSAQTNVALIKFWMGLPPSGNSGYRNVMILKYAEAILNYAEALANVDRFSEAYTQINRIRTRAKLANKPTKNNIDDCLRDINKERRIENCFDQNGLWYDLTRTKQAQVFLKEEHNIEMPDYKYLFPLPETELYLNKNLVQNPGY